MMCSPWVLSAPLSLLKPKRPLRLPIGDLKRKQQVPRKNKHLPTPQVILEFIKSSSTKVGKRELSRAFNLKGQDRIWLKQLLKKMGEEGLIERGHRRKVHSPGKLPPVTLVDVSPELSEEGEVLLIP